MKLDYVAAALTAVLILCISLPRLFAEEINKYAVRPESYFITAETPNHVSAKTEKSDGSLISDMQNRLYLGTANISKYGVDLISASDFGNFDSVRLRTGFSSLSKSATAGVQLIVNW